MKLNIKLSKYVITTGILWGVCAIIFGIGYFALYRTQKDQLAQIQTELNESQLLLDKALLASKKNTREKMLQQLESTSELIENFTTRQDMITKQVFEIGQIANDLGLREFSSMNKSTPDHSTVGKAKILTEAWLEVDFIASFKQFSEFINRLERNCPVVFVEEVSLRRGNKTDYGHQATLKLSFLAKTKNESKKIASAMH